MITQWVVAMLHDLFATIVAFLGTILPAAPTFWSDATAAISSTFAMIPSAVLYFIPVGPVVTAGTAFLTLVLVLGLLRLSRRLVSLFTGGGGMA